MKQLLDTDPLIEPSHYPHLHRMWLGDVPAPVAVAVATQWDGTLRLLPTSPKPLMAEIDRSDAAVEGGRFREPAPARVHVNEEGPQNEGASWRETLLILGLPAAIFLIAFGLWAWKTWG